MLANLDFATNFMQTRGILRQYDNPQKAMLFRTLYLSLMHQSFRFNLPDTFHAIHSTRAEVKDLLYTDHLDRDGPLDEHQKTKKLDMALYSLLVVKSYIREVKVHTNDIKAELEFYFDPLPPDRL